MELKNKIYLGDCIEIMKKIPDNSISSCITDPPYNYEIIGKEWDKNEIDRRLKKIKNSNTLVKNIPYGNGLSGGVRNKNWYKKARNNILDYQNWCEQWGKELYRILKPGALVLVFNSTRTVAHIQVALENVGFYARDIIVWKRNSGIPKGLNMSKNLEKMGIQNTNWDGWNSCLRNSWEAISVVQKPLENNYLNTLNKYGIGLFNTKTEEGFQSNIIENIKRESLDVYNTHCTVKPLKLIEKLVTLITPTNTDNIIIDPFLGSGTTAVVCKQLSVKYLGVEINKEYFNIAEKRLENVSNI